LTVTLFQLSSKFVKGCNRLWL